MYVYFIQSKNKHGPIKIGKAMNINRRMQNMQTAHPWELKLLALIPCVDKLEANDLETKLHKRFKKYRIRGEWFSHKIYIKNIQDIELKPYEH